MDEKKETPVANKGRKGRPKGSKSKLKLSSTQVSDLVMGMKCTRCGTVEFYGSNKFYTNRNSTIYTSNGHYPHICSKCANDVFDELKEKLKDTKIALLVMCHYLDMYFSENLYEQIKNNDEFTLGQYLRYLNGVQYKGKTFLNTCNELLENGFKSKDEINDLLESKWNNSDIQNKNYVLSTIGYDCFLDSSYSNDDRKYLFNTLAEYLTDDVIEDNHKLQSIIIMVKTSFQVETINRMINTEIKKNASLLDLEQLKTMSEIKDKMVRSVNTLASENGISAKSSGKKKSGSSTLTGIMREMQENDYEEIKVNIVNAKLSKSYSEIAEQNAKALIDELNFTTDDYASMVAKQNELISSKDKEIEKLSEQVRLLRLKLSNKKAKVGVD